MSCPKRSPRRPGRRIAAIVLLGLLTGCSDEGATAGERAPTDPAMKAIDAFIVESKIDMTGSKWKTSLKKPPKVTFDASKTYYWKLQTNKGEIRFRMLDDIAPMHVASTFYLTRLGFYDGLGFHRIVQGFMAQGGDPLGNGRGGPGYKYAGEFNKATRHDGPGVLSMANAGPGTDGSQFFITFQQTPSLDDRHTIFGRAESPESLATIKLIESFGAPRDPGTPTEPIVIERATIIIE